MQLVHESSIHPADWFHDTAHNIVSLIRPRYVLILPREYHELNNVSTGQFANILFTFLCIVSLHRFTEDLPRISSPTAIAPSSGERA